MRKMVGRPLSRNDGAIPSHFHFPQLPILLGSLNQIHIHSLIKASTVKTSNLYIEIVFSEDGVNQHYILFFNDKHR